MGKKKKSYFLSAPTLTQRATHSLSESWQNHRHFGSVPSLAHLKAEIVAKSNKIYRKCISTVLWEKGRQINNVQLSIFVTCLVFQNKHWIEIIFVCYNLKNLMVLYLGFTLAVLFLRLSFLCILPPPQKKIQLFETNHVVPGGLTFPLFSQ